MKCNECAAEFDEKVFARHLRKHQMTYEEYRLKFDYGGKRPLCKCGCGQETAWNVALKGFAQHVLGHHAWGRQKTEEEKKKIGEKNSQNMIEYWEKHPERKAIHSELMRKKLTPEIETKRKETLRRTYANMSAEWRKECSDRAIRLLSEGKIGPQAPFKAQWMDNPFTGQEEYMHSSWESAFLTECIQNNLPVTKKHSIQVPYVDREGTERIYIPDFVTLEPDIKIIFEMKGRRDENTSLKDEAAKRWCEENGFRFVVVGNGEG